MLPDIDIKIDVEPEVFLENIRQIAIRHEKFTLRSGAVDLGFQMKVVNLDYIGKTQHTDLGVQFIAFADRRGRIAIEIRAHRWHDHAFQPREEIYVQAARETAGIILKKYNRVQAKRHRLRIRQPLLKPVPSKLTLTALDRFCRNANPRSLSEHDWRRFYGLVRETRQVLSPEAFAELLRQRSFSSDAAEMLGKLYFHLKRYKHQN